MMNVLAMLAMTAALLSAGAGEPAITYTVSIPQPQTHLFDVEMKIDGLDQQQLDLSMPVWTPGSYLIREYEREVVSFEVLDGSNNKLAWKKIDKNTWRVETEGIHSVTARYQVYGRENSIRFSYVNESHGHILGVNLFFFIDGKTDLPATLKLNLPEGWKVSTGLIPDTQDPTIFTVKSYHELVDSPMLIGKHKEFKFEVEGIPHVMAIEGRTDADLEKYVEGTKKIVEVCAELFGGLPYKKYCFIMRFSPDGGGGLEHANGTTMGTRPWGFTEKEMMRRLFGLTAHEYFHAWNVKRIQPPAFKPYDYNVENYTDVLWFSEGVTSYYTPLLMLRAGLLERKDYLKMLADQIYSYRQQPGRLYQSATESSFDTWIKQYRPDENSQNATISYYTKGSIAGLLLDLEIIRRTNGAKSLDDVLRVMWQDTRKDNRGFESDDIRRVCEQVAGGSFEQLFKDYVFGVKEVPFEDFLDMAGYKLEVDEERVKRDQKGGYIGAHYSEEGGKVIVRNVFRDTSAWKAGLDANDEIIALDGVRITSSNALKQQLISRKAGDTVEFLVGREGLVEKLRIKLEDYPLPNYVIKEVKEASTEQTKIREKWLKAAPAEKENPD